MVESKPVLDFLVIAGNSRANASALSTYRIHRIISDPESMNGRLVTNLNAVDVNVRKSGGWWFFKKLFGQRTIAGGLDLEQQRRASFDASSVYLIKMGKPSVYLAFPDEYEDLPESIKSDAMLSLLFRLFYDAKRSEKIRLQILSDAGIQKTEQQDIMAQSVTKFNQFITSTFKQYSDEQINELKEEVKNRSNDSQPKKDYY